ncbi:DUF6421 family protein [Cohnella soli]|uniref:DUF6421 family protein n=1 Tax=Cohnella soli TaxID=425005 RepID=A0ABW0I5H9_9BACL
MPLMYSDRDISGLPWFSYATDLVHVCNELNQYLNSNGSMAVNETSGALFERLACDLTELIPFFNESYIRALLQDLEKWKSSDFQVPDFQSSYENYSREINHQFGFFLFPIYDLTYRTKNVSLGACFLYRNEDSEIQELRSVYSDAVFQGVELLLATNAFIKNNVFTFFPENIYLPWLSDQRKFAYFFISNYLKIFFGITKPLCLPIMQTPLRILNVDAHEVYDVRSVFSFVHDHFHYQGVLPFNDFYPYKTTLLGSFFEEARVDALTCLNLLKRGTENSLMAAELILLERMFRYSYTNEPTDSFDTLTNYYFLRYLLEKKAITVNKMKFSFDFNKIPQSLESLTAEIDEVEVKMLCSSPMHFEKHIRDWACPYLEFDHEGRVLNTLFSKWLKENRPIAADNCK